MDVIVTFLLCVIGFLAYLLRKKHDEVVALKNELHRLQIQKSDAVQSLPAQAPPLLVIDKNIFVRVIFKKNDTKYYDYLLGDNRDVKIGDFVEVYFNNKISGKTESHVAKVIYISKPGEISEYARSKIKRKAARPKW